MGDILTVVGENIKYYRTKLGMTQEELAERAGINRSYLAGLERGRRNTTLKTVEMLAQALGVSSVDLVGSADVLPEKKLIKSFGEKLFALRKRDNLSQRQLGEILGVSGSHIGALERGEKMPNAPLILKIADIFGVTTDQLMRDEMELS